VSVIVTSLVCESEHG